MQTLMLPSSLQPHFLGELQAARVAYNLQDAASAFHHLERAHVLGQRWALSHTHVHLLMLGHGLRTRNLREILGQVPRIVFGFLGSLVGRVPTGNTGGANVKAEQCGTGELIPPVVSTPELLVFEVSLTVSFPTGEAPPRLTGPGVQGPVGGRFLYVNAGTSAGQVNSCWTRRAKVPLPTLTPELLKHALSSPELVLQASIHGQARDGGPACASVRLLGNGWVVAPAFVPLGA